MLEYWLWLSGRRGLGVRGLRALLEQFGTPEAVYCASDAEYPSDIRPDGRTSLADKELAPARQILQQCYRQCIHIVTLQDAVYPQRLKNIDDAPLVLYYQGVLPDFDAEPVIAMVGTRRASASACCRPSGLATSSGATARSSSPAARRALIRWRCAAPSPPERRRWRYSPAAWTSTIRQPTGACLRIFAPTAAS